MDEEDDGVADGLIVWEFAKKWRLEWQKETVV